MNVPVVAGVGIWTTGPVPSAQLSMPYAERRLTHRDIVVEDPVLNSPLNRVNFSPDTRNAPTCDRHSRTILLPSLCGISVKTTRVCETGLSTASA